MMKKRFGLIKNFSVPARLHTSGALALLGLIVTCYAGYTGLTQSNDSLARSIMTTSAVLNQKDADMKHDGLYGDVMSAMLIGPDGPSDKKQDVRTRSQEHIASFKTDMQNLNALDLNPAIKQQIAVTMPLVDVYIASADHSINLALTDKAAFDANNQKFMDDFRRLEVNMGELGNSIESIGNTLSHDAVKGNVRLIQVVLAASAIAALILVISNILIARSITKPLERVKNAIKEVAAGNLDERFSEFERVSDLRDEVSEIAKYLEELRIRLREALELKANLQVQQEQQQIIVAALGIGLENLSTGDLSQPITTPFAAEYESLRTNFNRALDRMNQTIGQIVQTSRSIRARADDISTGAEDLSRRTENQAATLEQTAAALDELTASIKSAASGAREVETIVQNAKREAEDSGQVVQSAVEAMTGIERSSNQISQIIGVIDDIAFQTNLLALNAGVEAARAGDAGRGFAVVASEVRALAQRSSDASKEIKSLISSSVKLVGRGVEAVGGAGKALTLLVDRVTHISSLVSGIATGAAEQATALAEVNVGVTQLDQVAQRNAAMVEQSSTSTSALQSEAIGLDKLVSQFTTSAVAAPASRPAKDKSTMRAVA